MPIHEGTGAVWRSRRVENGKAKNGSQADPTVDDEEFGAKHWLSRHFMDSGQKAASFDTAQKAEYEALKALETKMERPVISRLLNRVHHAALSLDELVDDLLSFAEKTFFPGENIIYDDGEDGVPDGKSNCVVRSSIASSRYNINVDGSDLVGVSARCLRRCHPLSANNIRHLVLLTCSRQTATNNKKGAARSEAKKDTWLVDDEQKEKFGIHDRLAPIFCKAQRTDQDMASTPSSAQPKKEEVKKREKKKKVAEQKKQNGEGAEKRRLSDKENGRDEEAGEEAENEEEPATKKARKKAVKEGQKGIAEMKNGPEKKKEKKRMSGGAEPEVIVVEDGKEELEKGNGEESVKKARKKAAKEEIVMEDTNQDAKPKKTGKKETAAKENGTEKKKGKKRLSGEAENGVVIVEEDEKGEEEKGQGEENTNGKSKKRSGEKMEENGMTEEKTPKKQKQSTLSAFVQRVAAPSTGSSSSKEKEIKREDKMLKLKVRKTSQSEDPKALSTLLMAVYKTVSLAEITEREKQLEVEREKKTSESEKDRSHQELLILQLIRAYKMSDEKKQQLTRESNEKEKAQIQEELEQWKKLKKILRKKINKKKGKRNEDEHQEEQSDERIHTTPLQLAGAVAMTSPYFPDALMISQFFLAHRADLHVPRLYHIPQAEKLLHAIDSPSLSDAVLLPLVIGMLKTISKSPEYETIVSCQQCIGLLEVNQFTWLEILLAVIRGERAMTRRQKEKEEQKMGIHQDARESRSATREGSVVPMENQDEEEEVDGEEALDDTFIDTDTRSRLLSCLDDADGRSFGKLSSDVQISILVLLVNRVLDCLPLTASKTSDKKRELVKHRQELAEKLRPLKTQRDEVREECARLEKAGRALTRYLSGKLSNLEHDSLSTEEELQSVIDEINELNQRESQTCRVSCLGVDRHGRRFYVFPKSATGLFLHVTEYYEWHVDEDGTAQPELIRDEEAFECISSEGDILGAVKLLEKGTKSEVRLSKAIQLQLRAGAFQPLKAAIDGEEEEKGEETKAAETVSDSKWWIQHTKQELINLATELDKKQFLGRQNSEPLPETFLDDISEKKSISVLKEVAVRMARSIGCVSGPFRVFDPNFPCAFSPNAMVNDIEDANKGSVLYFLIQVFRSRIQWEYTKKKMAKPEEREDEEEKDESKRKLRPRGRGAPNSAEDNEEITKMIDRIQQGRLYKTLLGLEVDGEWRLEDLFDRAKEMPVQRFKRRLGKMMLAWREHFEEFLPRKLEQFNELEEELDL